MNYFNFLYLFCAFFSFKLAFLTTSKSSSAIFEEYSIIFSNFISSVLCAFLIWSNVFILEISIKLKDKLKKI